MANRHIKVINGRKYYYESIRVGKKVTSRYLGPVERVRKRKVMKGEQQLEQQLDAQPANTREEFSEDVPEPSNEDSYIG